MGWGARRLRRAVPIGAETGIEAGQENGIEAGQGIDIEAGQEIGTKADQTTGIEAGQKTGIEAGQETGIEADQETVQETGIAVGRQTGIAVGLETNAEAVLHPKVRSRASAVSERESETDTTTDADSEATTGDATSAASSAVPSRVTAKTGYGWPPEKSVERATQDADGDYQGPPRRCSALSRRPPLLRTARRVSSWPLGSNLRTRVIISQTQTTHFACGRENTVGRGNDAERGASESKKFRRRPLWGGG